MALLPIAFRVQIDEDGNVAFAVEEGKRLTAWQLWATAVFLEHTAEDLHARDRAAAEANSRPPLVVAGGLPRNGARV